MIQTSFFETLQKSLGSSLTHASQWKDEKTVETTPEMLLYTLSYLREHYDFQFQQLMDIAAVDYLGKAPKRFMLVYHLLSPHYNRRLRIKIPLDDGDIAPSTSHLFKSAPWWEREIWDLFGIPFEGLEDHRRILNEEGFDGHPLRKDFPLTGYTEIRYDEESQDIITEPVELPQAYRTFDTQSPWEGVGTLFTHDHNAIPTPAPGEEES